MKKLLARRKLQNPELLNRTEFDRSYAMPLQKKGAGYNRLHLVPKIRGLLEEKSHELELRDVDRYQPGAKLQNGSHASG